MIRRPRSLPTGSLSPLASKSDALPLSALGAVQRMISHNAVAPQRLPSVTSQLIARAQSPTADEPSLLKVLQTHKLMEAANEGEAEAARVKAFLAETQASVPELKQRVALWQTLRKQDALAAVSSGDARLYFTPNDVNLTIESKEA